MEEKVLEKRTYTIEATPEQLNQLERMFGHITHIGDKKISGRLLLWINGSWDVLVKFFKEDGSQIVGDNYNDVSKGRPTSIYEEYVLEANYSKGE